MLKIWSHRRRQSVEKHNDVEKNDQKTEVPRPQVGNHGLLLGGVELVHRRGSLHVKQLAPTVIERVESPSG
jgi:hypothetical protein